MISRVAEHCFWLSRYLERAENTARMLDVNHTLLLDFDVPVEQQWRPFSLIINGIHDFRRPADAETVQEYLTWDADNPCSIVSSLSSARENARVVREVISGELWERMNYYYLWLQSSARALYTQDRNEFYNQVRRINQLLHGIGEATMSRDEAWDFFQLGRYLERACQTGRIFDVKYHILLPTPEQVGTPIDEAHWAAILKSCSGYEVFHKQHRATTELGSAVAEFLIFDNVFPRSIRHCLGACRQASHRISGRKKQQPGNEAEQRLDELFEWLNLVTIDDLVRTGLHESLTSVIDRIHDIGAAIRRTYFDFRMTFEAPAAFASQSQVQSGA